MVIIVIRIKAIAKLQYYFIEDMLRRMSFEELTEPI